MIRPYAHKKGFTIVEVIIVIVVIAILAAITIVSYTQITKDTQQQAVQNDLQAASAALNKYKSTNGTYKGFSMTDAGVKWSSGASYVYRTNDTLGTFCFAATLNGVTSNIESGSRTVQEGECAIINLVANPSAETNVTGVVGYSSVTPTRTTSSPAAVSGSYVFSITTNSATAVQGMYHLISDNVVPGTIYTCSVSLKASAATTVSVSGRAHTAAGAYYSEGLGSKSLALTTAWQRINVTFTVPTNATVGKAYLQYRQTAAATGITIQSDAIICTEGATAYNYADGSKTGWSWLGTANASASKGKPL